MALIGSPMDPKWRRYPLGFVAYIKPPSLYVNGDPSMPESLWAIHRRLEDTTSFKAVSYRPTGTELYSRPTNSQTGYMEVNPQNPIYYNH